MLPRSARLRRSSDFGAVLRRGRRAGRPLLSLSLLVVEPSSSAASLVSTALAQTGAVPARAGLVVSRAVGNSVVRHRTSRRLRALLAARLPDLPAGARLVVRAAPPAGQATSAALAVDLDRALARLLRGPTPAIR